MNNVKITASNSYFVSIGKNILQKTGKIAALHVHPQKALLLTDKSVPAEYAKTVLASFKEAGFEVFEYILSGGEAEKDFDTVKGILCYLADKGFSRSDMLVVLGGGIVGDIGGFTASMYSRGIAFVQIPTTFLSAIDSSIGGKTAVNLDGYKNIIGTFYQPTAVICDTAVFATLPKREMTGGMAEAIKYGVICDEGFFKYLSRPVAELNLEEAVERCVKIKAEFVKKDEFDKGERMLLNFGHTFGHAIEKASNFAYSHGEAVACGMVMAAKIAAGAGLCDKSVVENIIKVLKIHSLPYECDIPIAELESAILHDKKRRGENILFIFPEKIGKCVIRAIPQRELPHILALAEQWDK